MCEGVTTVELAAQGVKTSSGTQVSADGAAPAADQGRSSGGGSDCRAGGGDCKDVAPAGGEGEESRDFSSPDGVSDGLTDGMEARGGIVRLVTCQAPDMLLNDEIASDIHRILCIGCAWDVRMGCVCIEDSRLAIVGSHSRAALSFGRCPLSCSLSSRMTQARPCFRRCTQSLSSRCAKARAWDSLPPKGANERSAPPEHAPEIRHALCVRAMSKPSSAALGLECHETRHQIPIEIPVVAPSMRVSTPPGARGCRCRGELRVGG